jgi:hypothetical protein
MDTESTGAGLHGHAAWRPERPSTETIPKRALRAQQQVAGTMKSDPEKMSSLFFDAYLATRCAFNEQFDKAI